MRKEFNWEQSTTTASRLFRWTSFKLSSSLWSLAKFTNTYKENDKDINLHWIKKKICSKQIGHNDLLGPRWSGRRSSPLCWAPPCGQTAGRRCGRERWETRPAGTAACYGVSPLTCSLEAPVQWTPSQVEGQGLALPLAEWWCNHLQTWGWGEEKINSFNQTEGGRSVLTILVSVS